MTRSQDIAVEVRGVAKNYRRGTETVAALHDVSLTIKKGEIVAITGPSGSGKTTLTHIIGGLLTPDKGDVLIDDQLLKKRSDRTLSHYRNTKVGFVFQNFSLIPHYTALENVTLPLIVTGTPPRKRRKRATELLQSMGLEHRLDQRVDKLSGGERQRVSIARALAAEPAIIIADEPTGSLDSARGDEIMTILKSLNQQHDITIVIVTHDSRLATQADRSITLKDGEIVGGAHA